MPNRAYTSHRSRRCSARECVRSGRIIPGDLVFRRGHRYYHVADLVVAIEAVRRSAERAAIGLRHMSGAIVVLSGSVGRYSVAAAARHAETAAAASVALERRRA